MAAGPPRRGSSGRLQLLLRLLARWGGHAAPAARAQRRLRLWQQRRERRGFQCFNQGSEAGDVREHRAHLPPLSAEVECACLIGKLPREIGLEVAGERRMRALCLMASGLRRPTLLDELQHPPPCRPAAPPAPAPAMLP